MRIGIIHNSLNSTGGGERVCLRAIEALKEGGHEVILGTVEPTDWVKVNRIMGGVTKPDEELSLLRFKVRIFGIYMRLLTSLLIPKLRRICELIINMHGDILPFHADVIYIHYPTFALLRGPSPNVKYSQSLLWRAYFIPYETIQNFLSKDHLSQLILTNSIFSRKVIRRLIGRNAHVVYPPVDIERFSKASVNNERSNIVVSCGRYTPEKNYEFVLRVADKLRNEAKFMIIGAYSGRISAQYYKRLTEIIMRKKLKNVRLLRNVSFSTLLKIYRDAKVFLHAMRHEHFGISVVEAMAAGLVPVVHRSGGPWEDILKSKQGLHGFSYLTADEAAGAIRRLIREEALRRRIVKRNADYVNLFSSESFKRNFLYIIGNIRTLKTKIKYSQMDAHSSHL